MARRSAFKKERSYRRVGAALAMFFLVFVLVISRVYASPTSNKYILMIDAGSSGTRVYIYTYSTLSRVPRVEVFKGKPAVALPRKLGKGMYERVETQPGLGELLRDPGGIKTKGLQPLLTWAASSIPRRMHGCTPVYLLATGGVRSLPAKDAEELLQAVRDVLKGSPFLFEQQSMARVISGAEEGAYSFVALAYSKGLLKDRESGSGSRHEDDGLISVSSTTGGIIEGGSNRMGEMQSLPVSLGILDLGGSSLQITQSQPPGKDGHADSTQVARRTQLPAVEDIKDITVGDMQIHLSASTFHRCGLMEIWDRSIDLLLSQDGAHTEEDGLTRVKHPCLHQGYASPYNRLHPESGTASDTASISLVGAPDVHQCLQLAGMLAKPCSSLSEPLQGEVVGISGFYVVPQFLGLANQAAGALRIENLQPHASRYLSLPFEKVKGRLGQHLNFERYPLWGLYAHQLLGPQGLNLPSDRFTIGSRDMSWPLGAALVEISEHTNESLRLKGGDDAWPCSSASASTGSVLPSKENLFWASLAVAALIFVVQAYRVYNTFMTNVKTYSNHAVQ